VKHEKKSAIKVKENFYRYKKEPAVTFATAAMNLYTAHCNLSTAIDHYKAHNNLCSTIMSTLEAGSNLPGCHRPPINSIKYCGTILILY
jgi:hypothetical protein